MRRFAPHIETLARRCFENPESQEAFTISGAPAGGATTAIPITINANGIRAYAKPARAATDNGACVAHEKIASDIGYKLGLPVAPVLLSRACTGTALPPIVALSYMALPQPRPWGQVSLSPDELTALRPVLAAMYAFHVWIDDHDHNWNVVRTVFIDYTFSLTHQWNPPAAAPVRPWHTMTGPYANTDFGALTAAIGKIERL
jgi:hypothetical protein